MGFCEGSGCKGDKMSQAVKCPICYGEGMLMDGSGTSTCPTKTCHGCYGKGWVEVGISEQSMPGPNILSIYPPYFLSSCEVNADGTLKYD